MLSKKDKQILSFIYEHGSITINQCAKCVYAGNKFAYDQARKRLRKLYSEKAIARYRSAMTEEAIYYINTRLNIHALKLLDVYCELIQLGADIKTFHKKYRIYTSEKKYREIDALIELYYNDYFIPLIIEIDYSHNTSLVKLQEIYNSNHFPDKYKDIDEDIFPLIIIVRPVIVNCTSSDNNFPILYVDFNLQNLVAALE